MKIAVYGATGAIGSAIVDEARHRGHEVTGISRRGGEGPADLAGDALDADFATGVAEKHDVVVSAIGPSRVGDDGSRFVQDYRAHGHVAGRDGRVRLGERRPHRGLE